MNYLNCIYKFTFPNGKVYIGQTVNFNHRMNTHKYTMKTNKTKNIDMYSDMEKYGWNNITREILVYNIPKEYLNKLEGILIDYYDSYNNGYNQTPGWKFTKQIKEIETDFKNYKNTPDEKMVNNLIKMKILSKKIQS